MNQGKAKSIKKDIYGDYSPKFRQYKELPNGQIIADDRLLAYLDAKKK